MGTDYASRKAVKSKRKRLKDDDAGEPRKRTKNKVRRLCRGMCYSEPRLTGKDLEADQAGSDADDDLKISPSMVQQILEEEQQQAMNPKPAKKFSTAVNLVQYQQEQNEDKVNRKTKKKQRSQNKAAAAADSPALAAYPEAIQKFMLNEGFMEPTVIQAKVWPICLRGQNTCAVSEPGSGKTLGYLLPALQRLLDQGHGADSQPEAPLVLVLLPTRELAQQVSLQCRPARGLFGLRTACIHGGADRGAQLAALQQRPHLIVATPGRLLELLEEGLLSLGSLKYVVLDEADKMLSLGMQPQLDQLKAAIFDAAAVSPTGIAGDTDAVNVKVAGGSTNGRSEEAKRKKKKKVGIPFAPAVMDADDGGKEAWPKQQEPSQQSRRPQVCLFTATLPIAVEETAAKWAVNAEHVRVGVSAASISRTVTQVVQVCAEHKKPAKLLKHLAKVAEAAPNARNPPRVLIFANRVKTVRFLFRHLAEAGFRVVQLHGERSQPEREEALSEFRSGKAQLMVATDVAARGLHIRGLPYVVNYDFPPSLPAYIHRVGRTGRLAAHGHAFSFFTRPLAPLAQPLLELLQETEQAVDPNLVRLAEAYNTAAKMVASATGPMGVDSGEAPPAAADGVALASGGGSATTGSKGSKAGHNRGPTEQAAQLEEDSEGGGQRRDGGEAVSEDSDSGTEAVETVRGTVMEQREDDVVVVPRFVSAANSILARSRGGGAGKKTKKKSGDSTALQLKQASIGDEAAGKSTVNGESALLENAEVVIPLNRKELQKSRSLPGRLRKKLAKDRAAGNQH